MGSVVIEVCEGVDEGLEFFDSMREVEAAIELIAPRALGALDSAIELRPFGRQDEVVETLVGAGRPRMRRP